ncbi:MAG: hypothetical protein K6E96_00850 [Bacteroidales bacterium]|nr:hypothetical protein [Bacteroidales bacterium]
MKRRILLASLLASVLLMTSCNKDDMELLKHPYRLQGTLDPSFGLPVVSSDTVNLNDLLMLFDGTFTGMITEDNTITFHYDTSIRETIIIGGMIGKQAPAQRPAGKSKGSVAPKMSNPPFIARDTIIEYSIPIDLFDKADMQSIVDGNIAINELMLNLDVFVQGGCPPNVEQALRDYVQARIDQVTIRYVGHNNQAHTFTGFAAQSLVLDDIIDGGTVEFDDINLAEIVNSMPRYITAAFHMHVEVDSAIVYDNLGTAFSDPNAIDFFSTLLDSLKMTYLTFGADMNVDLPFEIHIGSLPYSYELDINGDSENSGENTSVIDMLDTVLTNILGEGAVSVDSSKVTAILVFNNGIPLDLTLDGYFVDQNGLPTYTLFTNKTVASAITAPVPDRPGVSQAVADSATRIEIPLTVEGLDKMVNASKLKLTLKLATTDNDFKVIKRDDYLKIKLMVKLDPSINIDMELFDPTSFPFVGTILEKLGN